MQVVTASKAGNLPEREAFSQTRSLLRESNGGHRMENLQDSEAASLIQYPAGRSHHRYCDLTPDLERLVVGEALAILNGSGT